MFLFVFLFFLSVVVAPSLTIAATQLFHAKNKNEKIIFFLLAGETNANKELKPASQLGQPLDSLCLGWCAANQNSCSYKQNIMSR